MSMELTYDILDDVYVERERQDAKWGVQHHPDGTEAELKIYADRVRIDTDDHAANGSLTWADILEEEFAEACAEIDWPKLRKELVQVAAVCVAWIEDGDSRA